MSSEPALTREACDACAGREPVEITCARHFLKSLEDPYQGPNPPCSACGWPAKRAVPECEGHPVIQQMRRHF